MAQKRTRNGRFAAKKRTTFEDLRKAGVDYSIPIDKFSRKAKAMFNKLAKKKGYRVRCDGAEYNDGSARLYLTDELSINLLCEFSNEVHILVEDFMPTAKLVWDHNLRLKDVTVGNYEITVVFH